MTVEEETKNNDYLHALSVEDARRRVREFRDRVGWDKESELGGPAPLPLLAEVLYEMHKTVERVLGDPGYIMPGDLERELLPWFLPLRPANPVYDPIVLLTAEKLAESGWDLPPGGISYLQDIFDAGREAGADQEAIAQEQRTRGLINALKDPLVLCDPSGQAPEKYQCLDCGDAVYTGEKHVCPAMQAKAQAGQSFRSFGDRR